MKDKFKETLSNILSYLLKVERRTLLWENPNMTGEMGATTITLSDDLSNYDAIEIDYNAYVNVHRTSQRCYNISQDITLSNGDSNSLYRTISKASERTLSIGIGYLGANASNQACIPRRIYGIKLGGVLRSPVVSRLCAILKIGGGVNEGRYKGTVGKVNEKSKHSIISRAGDADVLHSVDLGYTGRSDGLRSAVSILSDVGNNKHLGIQELGVFCTIRAVGDSVCKLANKCRRRFTKFHNASGGIHYRALTISGRRWAS